MTKEEKCSNTQKNRIIIHKGNKELRIYKDDLEKYLADGWEKGISENHRETLKQNHLGQQAWNKGKTWSDETKAKMSQNYKYHEPWNKGLTVDSSDKWKQTIEKATTTKIEKYGNGFGNNNMSEAHKQKIKEAQLSKTKEERAEIIRKVHQGMKENNTYCTSKPEEKLNQYLIDKYDKENVIRQYKEDRYPFYCDFYIKSEDLFIEVNIHWTHGKMIFDEKNEKCNLQLEEWQNKAKTSKYYKQAIINWTKRDVLKLNTAKENNLNYITIYTLDELNSYIDN